IPETETLPRIGRTLLRKSGPQKRYHESAGRAFENPGDKKRYRESAARYFENSGRRNATTNRLDAPSKIPETETLPRIGRTLL
ncbi:hypothetical protein, partial [Bhargavaea cecembensis]|uniref:hypothetical protein n=1 Tax=Bhargavaea cecembensis TaxID=394098 RepID=UPI00058B0F64